MIGPLVSNGPWANDPEKLGTLTIVTLLTLGRDQEAYNFTKFWFMYAPVKLYFGEQFPWPPNRPNYEAFRQMLENGDGEQQSSCKENFFEQHFFRFFSSKNKLGKGPCAQMETLFEVVMGSGTISRVFVGFGQGTTD